MFEGGSNSSSEQRSRRATEKIAYYFVTKKKSLKLGICGEHGGDPASIEFCEKTKLNYVSCSPYRVPIARLAAAQAYLKRKK